jgi:hypothetical protein
MSAAPGAPAWLVPRAFDRGLHPGGLFAAGTPGCSAAPPPSAWPKMSAGGSLAEAAAFLSIDHRYLKASPGSAAFAGDPAEFRLAVHTLARASAPPRT